MSTETFSAEIHTINMETKTVQLGEVVPPDNGIIEAGETLRWKRESLEQLAQYTTATGHELNGNLPSITGYIGFMLVKKACPARENYPK